MNNWVHNLFIKWLFRHTFSILFPTRLFIFYCSDRLRISHIFKFCSSFAEHFFFFICLLWHFAISSQEGQSCSFNTLCLGISSTKYPITLFTSSAFQKTLEHCSVRSSSLLMSIFLACTPKLFQHTPITISKAASTYSVYKYTYSNAKVFITAVPPLLCTKMYLS